MYGISMNQRTLGIDASRYSARQRTGVEHYTQRIIDGLLEKSFPGIKIVFFCATKSQADMLSGRISDAHEIRLIERKRLWTHMGLGKSLKKNPVDLLFVPSHVLPFTSLKKSALVIHGLEASRFPQAYTRFQRWYQRFTTQYAVKHASKLIAVSESVKSDLMHYFNCPEEKIEVVYEGYDPAKIDERMPFNAPYLHNPYILNVGRIEERKNQRRLIDAFEMFHTYHPEWHLVLAGGVGYGAARIRSHMKTLSAEVRSRIHFVGHQDHHAVLQLMHQAKIFAYPSLAEGFGLPLLEAMGLGTPIVTSHGSALAEIGDDAIVAVDPLSSFEIFSGLRMVAENPTLQEKLKQRGFQRVKSFTWSRCVDHIHEVLLSQF